MIIEKSKNKTMNKLKNLFLKFLFYKLPIVATITAFIVCNLFSASYKNNGIV